MPDPAALYALAPPVLRMAGLCRTFERRAVLEGVDLTLGPGQVLALIGPNGGGKSTLLLMMAGLLRPTAGTVEVCGVPAHELAERQTGDVGLITAEPGVYPLLTGRENLNFFGGLYGLSPKEIARRSTDFLESLGLADDMERSVAEWSSGMRQKLSLARALLMSPKLLLLDEPTANLDPLAAHAIHETVRAQADRGVAVVLATHDLEAAEGICTQAALVRGRILATRTFEGPRRAPVGGALFDLYREQVGS